MDPDDDTIAAMTDPVSRNLWITERYHELAVGLRDCGAGTDATWCAFAVWASKTAGNVIRNDELPTLVRRLLAEEGADGVDRFNRAAQHHTGVAGLIQRAHLSMVVDRVCEDVARHIAEGNRLVFAELAGPFRAFTGACAEVPSGLQSAELERAFDMYARAFTRPEPERAWLILAGNVLAVAHEQQRLQPAIEAALDAAISDTLDQVLEDEIFAQLPRPIRRLLDAAVEELGRMLDLAWQAGLTRTVLRLDTADECLDLSADLPPLEGVLWPDVLAVLSPGEAAAVLAAWDRTRGLGRPTGALDWAELSQRMNYIVNLFRSRQRHPALLMPPFTAGQLAELRAGVLPAGGL